MKIELRPCINVTHYYAEYNADILVLDPVQGDSLLDEVGEPCSDTAEQRSLKCDLWSQTQDYKKAPM